MEQKLGQIHLEHFQPLETPTAIYLTELPQAPMESTPQVLIILMERPPVFLVPITVIQQLKKVGNLIVI